MDSVGNLVLFQQWKDYENPLRIDKVIAMSLVYYLLGDTVYAAAVKYAKFSF